MRKNVHALLPYIFLIVLVFSVLSGTELFAQQNLSEIEKEKLLSDSLPITTHTEVVVMAQVSTKCYRFWPCIMAIYIPGDTIQRNSDTSTIQKKSQPIPSSIRLFPNPIQQGQNAFIKYQGLKPGRYIVFIAETQARTLFSQSVIIRDKIGQIPIRPAIPAASGIYWLRIINEQGLQVFRSQWVKQ